MPFQAFADQPVDSLKNHRVYYGVGLANTNISLGDAPSDETETIRQLGYGYQFNQYFSLNSRWLRPFSNSDNLQFESLMLAPQARFSITENTFFYGQLGLSRYRSSYYIGENDSNKKKSSGVDIYTALGLKYQFSAFEISVEHQWLQMGDFKVQASTFNIGYRF